MAALNELVKKIQFRVERGETVALGNFGYFDVTLSGKGAATAKDVSSSHIEEVRLKFVPSKEISNTLGGVGFEKISSLNTPRQISGRGLEFL